MVFGKPAVDTPHRRILNLFLVNHRIVLVIRSGVVIMSVRVQRI